MEWKTPKHFANKPIILGKQLLWSERKCYNLQIQIRNGQPQKEAKKATNIRKIKPCGTEKSINRGNADAKFTSDTHPGIIINDLCQKMHKHLPTHPGSEVENMLPPTK
jgi:hypothetical protein